MLSEKKINEMLLNEHKFLKEACKKVKEYKDSEPNISLSYAIEASRLRTRIRLLTEILRG